MTEIHDEIMAKAREVAMQLNGGFFHADVNAIAAALLSERTASEAALTVVGYETWNIVNPNNKVLDRIPITAEDERNGYRQSPVYAKTGVA